MNNNFLSVNMRKVLSLLAMLLLAGGSMSRADTGNVAAVKQEAPPKQGDEMAVDIGGGVKMEFVWIEALKMWVGKYEVTNDEYRRSRKHYSSGEYRGHSLNEDRQPVVRVSYIVATVFAEWINRTGNLPQGYKCRLPDGDEWTTFAQCGDGRKYPWGNAMPPEYGNYADSAASRSFSDLPEMDNYDDGYPVACTVEQSGKNDWGLYGVGGNVTEWTSESAGSSLVLLRGGSWYVNSPHFLECVNRTTLERGDRSGNIGFRLVLSRDRVEEAGGQDYSDDDYTEE